MESSVKMLNNLNRNCERPHSKLSPRVMGDVELNILKPKGAEKNVSPRRTLPIPPSLAPRVPPMEIHGIVGMTSSSSVSSGETTPTSSTDGRIRDVRTDRQIQAQLQAYMAWINSQLKKKPGARLVEDLRNDTRDGVAFIDLIEVVSGEGIGGYHPVPSSYGEMKENVERVLHFMSSKKIKMHHIVAKDIVDGNLKSIMRLILALAAHYKPKSVKHSSQNSRSGNKSPNVTGIAQGASAALAAARRTVAKAGTSFRRQREYRRRNFQESSSDQFSDSDQSSCALDHSHHEAVTRDRREVDGASASSSPTASMINSPQASVSASTPVSQSRCRPKVSDRSISEASESVLDTSGTLMVEQSQYDDLMSDYLRSAEAMKVIKKELSILQDLLLSGQPPDGEEAVPAAVMEGTTPEEKLVILKSQLQQSQTMCSELREELSRHKLDTMQDQGVKSGLQQRLSEQEVTITQLKADLLRRDFEKQNFDSEKANIMKQIKDRDKVITNLKRELARRDQRIDHLQNEVRIQVREKENITKSLQLQIKDLHERLRVVGETGASLSARVASQDKKMAKLAGKIMHSHGDNPSQTRPVPTGTDELSVLRDALASLRHSFTNTDSQQHTIDTLEQGISTLMERLPHSNNSSRSSSSQNLYEGPNVSRKLNFDSTGDVRRSPITAIPGRDTTSFSVQKLDNPSINGQLSTKVLYFTENTTAPSMLTICKRLGEITLKDFKEHFDRPGLYRYHFKALDPEFGTVKEEISNEDAIIPGWEGKIVAWLEEDTGQG